MNKIYFISMELYDEFDDEFFSPVDNIVYTSREKAQKLCDDLNKEYGANEYFVKFYFLDEGVIRND